MRSLVSAGVLLTGHRQPRITALSGLFHCKDRVVCVSGFATLTGFAFRAAAIALAHRRNWSPPSIGGGGGNRTPVRYASGQEDLRQSLVANENQVAPMYSHTAI